MLLIDDETAIKSIEVLISKIQRLMNSYPHSEEHTQWVLDTLSILEDIFGINSRIYLTFALLTWEPSGSFIVRGPVDMDTEVERRRQQAYLEQLLVARGTLRAGIQLIQRKGVKNVYDGKDTPRESSEIIKIISIIDNKLRKIIRTVPKIEKFTRDA